MAFHYNDVKGRGKSVKYIEGYEVGWDIPVLLLDDYDKEYKYSRIAMINDAINIGYSLGMEAQKHAAEVPSTDPRTAQDVPGKA